MKINFLLTRPQLGENIGAAARIMLNFGFCNLKIVAPRDLWPNPKAYEMAAGATKLLDSALVVDHIKDALGGSDVVFAATARSRYMNKPLISVREVANIIKDYQNPTLMFGPERTGLENEELSYADYLVYIPVNELYTSINLAQAIGIFAYELSHVKPLEQVKQEVAPKSELIDFLDFLEHKLDEANFFKIAEKKPKMIINIRNLFNRVHNLTSQDIRTLYGIIKSFTK